MEQHEEAAAVAREANELDPRSALPHRILCGVYLDLEEHTVALTCAQTASTLKRDPETDRLIALALAGLGQDREAVATIEAGLLHEPELCSTHEVAARVFFLVKQFDRAEVHFRKALELDPINMDCLGWLGLTCLQQGRKEEALPLLEKSIAINPYQRRVRAALAAIAANGEDGRK